MLIVPHQDDEVLLADGIIEEFVKYGSEVYPVVVTAGSNGRERMRETLAVMSHEGVDEDNVIFLGYHFGQDSENIYNQQPDEVIRSEVGISESFGLPEHPAYREGLECTKLRPHGYTPRRQ